MDVPSPAPLSPPEPKQKASKKPSFRAFWGWMMAAAWTAYFLRMNRNLLFNDAGGLATKVANIYGDWAVHATYASVFAYRDPSLWFTSHPIMNGIAFNYPFVSSFVTGMLLRGGIGLAAALSVPSTITLIMLVWVLFLFYRHLLGTSLKAGVALSLSLIGGGFGWIVFLVDLGKAAGLDGVVGLLIAPPLDYSKINGTFYQVGSTLSCLLFPQRAIQLGLVLALSVLWYLDSTLKKAQLGQKPKLAALGAAGIVVGLMPIIHAHSAIVLAIASFFLTIKFRPQFRWMLIYGAVAAAVGAMIIALFMRPGAQLPADITPIDVPFAGWQVGWLTARLGIGAYLHFWLSNWGFFLPLMLLGMVHTPWRRDPFVWTGLALFALVSLARLQPWDWDNTKLLLYAYLFLVPPVIDYLAALMDSKPLWSRLVALSLALSMLLTGAVEAQKLLGWRQAPLAMWSKDDLERAKALRAIVPPGKLFLSSLRHTNWVSSLTGSQILLGYQGWTWSYGYQTDARYAAMKDMYSGGAKAEQLLASYGIDYVVIDPLVRIDFNPNESFFKEHYTVVMAMAETNVYKIR